MSAHANFPLLASNIYNKQEHCHTNRPHLEQEKQQTDTRLFLHSQNVALQNQLNEPDSTKLLFNLRTFAINSNSSKTHFRPRSARL